MSFDGLVMAAVKKELQETIAGGRIEKIYQPLAGEIVLLVHKDRNKYRLLASADARDARVHLTRSGRENPLTPPMFCMVLRKHLEGGRIIDVEQHGLERVLHIRVEAVDELGMPSEKILACEVMGKHSNIILTDPASNTVLDGIHRYSYATSRHREVLPGRQYTPPPETGKLNPLVVDEEAFRSAVWDPDADVPVDRLILDRFEGFSPQTCREIIWRSGLGPETSSQSLGELELGRLWQAFQEVRNTALSGGFTPVVYYKGGRPTAFSAVTLTMLSGHTCRQGTISEVLDEFFTVRERQERFAREASELAKTVRGEIKKCLKKKAIHEENLRQTGDAESYKITGELITANIFQIPAGAESADLVNYYDPEQKTVTVALDPQLTPAENAQRYFKRYAKARTSRCISEAYLEETEAELAYLETVMLALEQSEQAEDLAQIKDEMAREGYIKPDKPGPKQKKPAPSPHQPEPLSIRSDNGFEILVGRNNRQNDYLTMKLARPGDTWLHVKGIPGSHVIIRNPGTGGIPDSTLQRAAEIAAYYSSARESSKVPVDYTLRKHVRKPGGAKPGMVIYDNQRTVLVGPKSP